MTQADHEFIENNLSFISKLEGIKFNHRSEWIESKQIYYIDLEIQETRILRIVVPSNVNKPDTTNLTLNINDLYLKAIEPLLTPLKKQVKDKIC